MLLPQALVCLLSVEVSVSLHVRRQCGKGAGSNQQVTTSACDVTILCVSGGGVNLSQVTKLVASQI